MYQELTKFKMPKNCVSSDKKAIEARTMMAKASGTDLKGYDAQLASTEMFYKAAAAVKFTESPKLIETMQNVSKFSFDHGLLGEGASDETFIGMGFPGGKTFGSKSNLKLRFNSDYMKMAAEGKL